MAARNRLGFRLDGLCQQPAGAVAQHGHERVVNRVGLTEGNNGDPGGEFGTEPAPVVVTTCKVAWE